jgi:hypothetical protein
MKLKRHHLLGFGVVIILAVSVGFGLSCHPRFHRFPHKGHHSQKFAERILNRIDKQVDLLDLSPGQKETYDSIREKAKEDFLAMGEERRAFFRTVKTEINLDDPDLERLSGLTKEHLGRLPGTMETYLDYFLEFYQVLNKEQQNQVLQEMRDKINRFPG